MLKRLLAALSFCLLPVFLCAQPMVQIQVHVDRGNGLLKPVWANVGHDEPNDTDTAEGRALLEELGKLRPFEFRDRTHNLLTTGDGTAALKWGSTNAYTEDAQGDAVEDWKIVDGIFDTYRAAKITPFVEIGFMPKALSTHPEPYRSQWPDGPLFTGWSYPPRDAAKWSGLIEHWVEHAAERYGRNNVAHWEWEVWNEPDIGYWHGTAAEYEALYDESAAAVKRALPEARVGGPATTGPASAKAAAFLRDFLTHCVSGNNNATGGTGAPLDFISFHAKGHTRMVDGHGQMDIGQNLADIAAGFAIVASYPSLRHLPVVISESDPDPCAACAASLHPENGYRNTPQYASYEAELLSGTLALAARYGINLQGYVTWAFTFPGDRYFEGYRSLATHGIDKPVMNAFRMFGMLEAHRVEATSSGQLSVDTLLKESARKQPDIGVMATRDSHSASILVWNYADDAVAAQPARIDVNVDGLPRTASRVRMRQFRVDEEHGDAYRVWQSMGSPQQPTPEEVEKLQAAGQLQLLSAPEWKPTKAGETRLSLTLPRQGVSLIQLDWGPRRIASTQ